MKRKNGLFELLRFIFCMVIFFHHSGFLANGNSFPFENGGAYAVEFFFILTGLLAMRHICSRETESDSGNQDTLRLENDKSEAAMAQAMRYTIKKLQRVFPVAMIGIVLSYIWNILASDSSLGIKDRLFGSWNIIYEMLFLPMTGAMDASLVNYMNAPLWYLSVVLIILPVVLYLAIRFKDVYKHYLCFFIPLFLYAYLIRKFGNIASWGSFSGWFYLGVIRGMAGLMWGTFIYLLSSGQTEKILFGHNLVFNRTNTGSRSNIGRLLFTVVELSGYFFSLYTFSSNMDGYTYLFAVFVLSFSMGITYSGQSYSVMVRGRIVEHLGALSLPIYCLHWPVYRFVTLYAKEVTYTVGVAISFICCIILSEIVLISVNALIKKA